MGQKKKRGVPIAWDELKKTRGFTLTETASEGLKALAKQYKCDSVSDFLERVARGIIPVGKDESMSDTVGELVIHFKGLEARLSNLERFPPTPRTVTRSPEYKIEHEAKIPPPESPQTDETANSGVFVPEDTQTTSDSRPACPECGSSESNAIGFRSNSQGKYRRLKCKDCGASFKEWVTKNPKYIDVEGFEVT